MAFGDRTIKILDVSDGQELFSCIGHSGNIASIAWRPDGKLLASASGDKTARVWDAQTESASKGQHPHCEHQRMREGTAVAAGP